MTFEEKYPLCYYRAGDPNLIDWATPEGITAFLKNTPEEMEQRYPGIKLMTREEAESAIVQRNKAFYLSQPPVLITEEQYNESLEMLPPAEWYIKASKDTASFRFPETSGNGIGDYFVQIEDKYYRLYAFIGTKHEDLLRRIKDVEA